MGGSLLSLRICRMWGNLDHPATVAGVRRILKTPTAGHRRTPPHTLPHCERSVLFRELRQQVDFTAEITAVTFHQQKLLLNFLLILGVRGHPGSIILH